MMTVPSSTDSQIRRKMDKRAIQYLLTQKADAGFPSSNKSFELIGMIMWEPDGAKTDGANSSFYCVVSGYKLDDSLPWEWRHTLGHCEEQLLHSESLAECFCSYLS